jgi:hypothetical protein
MARPKTPQGRRVTICAKVNEAEAAAIDLARGAEDLGTWLRRVALAAAERQQPPGGHAERQNQAGAQGDCPHPKARITKGLCNACGTYVGK